MKILNPGEIFAGYKISAMCGKGAFGVVYLVEDPAGRKLVLKIIESTLYSERELEGLRHYMQISGKHPGLLHVFHIGRTADGIYYTMEAADNCLANDNYLPATLGNFFRLNRKIPPEEAIRIIRELLSGLSVMHTANLIHRDIKPDNIIFVNGRAKLSDPGLVVNAGETVSFAGTPGFIPPEAFEADSKPDKSTDIYAMGKVFYCMITGYSPGQYPMLPMDMRVEVARQLYPALNRMCNRNPSKRFKDVEDFLKNLPSEMAPPNFLERLWEDFRSWKQLNRELYRKIQLFVLLVVLLAAGTAGALFWYGQYKKKQELFWQKQTEAFQAVNRERPELVSFQIQVYLPEIFQEYCRQNNALRQACRKKEWHKAAAYSRKLHIFLNQAARKLLPVIPSAAGDFKRDFEISGAAHSFLAAPLAKYLDEKTLLHFKKQLTQHDTLLYSGWNGVRCGRERISLQEYYAPMSFVPAGAVKMKHSGKTVKIPYHFWISQKEMCHEQFTRILNIAPQFSGHSNTPAERCIWNDVLFYCRIKTLDWQKSGILPPGYIVRVPTEAEWEYAARNAWLGKDDVPFEKMAFFKKNSNNRTWPSGALQPNKLGLYDIYGNVREMVVPEPEFKYKNSIITRGGSFIYDEKRCYERIPQLKMQNVPYDAGFRIVIAPGTMAFFDRHFYCTDMPEQARCSGKVYEAVGGNLGALDWESSRQICYLLGGRLGEIENESCLELIRNSCFLAGAWNTFAGGRKIGGVWRWLHSGKEINYGIWKKARNQDGKDNLAFFGNRWVPVKNQVSGTLLCEWDEKNYSVRNAHLKTSEKLPFEKVRFTYQGKMYILFDSSLLWYTAQRICELLGGRLACLDTAEKTEYIRKKLAGHDQNRILLGGYAKWNSFFWLSGKKAELELKKDKDALIPTHNRNFISLRDGAFFNSQYGSAFLGEFPGSSFSANSR